MIIFGNFLTGNWRFFCTVKITCTGPGGHASVPNPDSNPLILVASILKILGAEDIPLSDTGVGLLKAGTALGEGKSPFPRISVE